MWIIAQFSLITSERIYFSPQIRLDIDVEVRCEGAFREGTTLIGRGWHFIAQNALSSVSTESTANDHSRSKYSVVILICIPAMTQVYDFGLHVIINALQRHNYIAQTTVELFIGKIEERQPRPPFRFVYHQPYRRDHRLDLQRYIRSTRRLDRHAWRLSPRRPEPRRPCAER